MTSTRVPTPRAAPRRILEDASGRRLQRFRWIGRAVALLFLVWIAVVVLGGLGVGPAQRMPLGRLLRPSAGPPPARHMPPPAPPAPADLVPALPAPPSAVPGGKPKPSTRSRGKRSTAPGQAKTTTHGKSSSAPGHSRTTTVRGNSGSAPGRVKHAATTPTTTTVATVPGKSTGHGKKP